jgi:hypothetical protein
MCPIHADIKQFRGPDGKEFRQCSKVSSSMLADAGQVTIF